MFPSQSPLAVPRDQFTSYTSRVTPRRPRWGQTWLLVPAVVVGVTAWLLRPSMAQVAPGLLTAISILTGFTFTMAITFWTKTIEARRDPSWATDRESLQAIDQARTHMIWTVLIGVLAVALLALFSIFGHVDAPSRFAGAASFLTRLATAFVSLLAIYLITLVGAALRMFNQLVTILKA